jgi:RNA-directed DNA polymerase
MSREAHVRLCESRGVRFPPATHLVVTVAGQRDDAEALRDEVATVFAPMGLRLSEATTRVVHIDEGFDFLGWRIQRIGWRGRIGRRAVYSCPSKKALASVMDKVRSLTRRGKHRTLADLLRRLDPVSERARQASGAERAAS